LPVQTDVLGFKGVSFFNLEDSTETVEVSIDLGNRVRLGDYFTHCTDSSGKQKSYSMRSFENDGRTINFRYETIRGTCNSLGSLTDST
jgi:hypothetical protein